MYKTERPPNDGGRSVAEYPWEGIIGCAEGGNRTLIPGGNTILSRARLPVPPLRPVHLVYQSFELGQDWKFHHAPWNYRPATVWKNYPV